MGKEVVGGAEEVVVVGGVLRGRLREKSSTLVVALISWEWDEIKLLTLKMPHLNILLLISHDTRVF